MMHEEADRMPSVTSRILIGLVDESNAAGVQQRESSQWLLVFHLAAWRYPDTQVTIGGRRCEMPVSNSDLTLLMRQIPRYSVIEVEVAEEPDTGATRLKRILRTEVQDAELIQIAGELQKPIVIPRSPFGKLTYDRIRRAYIGRTRWLAKRIEVVLSCHNPEDPQTVFETTSRLFREQMGWRDRIDAYVVGELLPLKNTEWLGEKEMELSEEDFLSRMKLQSIRVDERGVFTFWFDDGGMFERHVIQVSGNDTEGLIEATISG